MVFIGHDDKSKKPVEPDVGYYRFKGISQVDQQSGTHIQLDNSPAEYHRSDAIRVSVGQIADQNGAQGNTNKMRGGNFEVIQHFFDVVRNGHRTSRSTSFQKPSPSRQLAARQRR